MLRMEAMMPLGRLAETAGLAGAALPATLQGR